LKRLLAGLALAGILLLVWYWYREPLDALELADPQAQLVGFREERREGRKRLFATLATERLGEVSIVVDLPEPLPARERLPVVLVLGGLAGGERNIGWITAPGPNAIVGYDWPVPTAMPQGMELAVRFLDIRAAALSIPGQLATALLWLRAQPWADGERVSMLGFSLGALAAPAAQRVAAAAGMEVGWTVLAYGGAPLGDLVAANPFLKPDWARPLLRVATDVVLRPGEPSLHLPHLAGRFLVLEGREDAFVPPRAAARYRSLTPEPKTVVAFEGGHMGVGPGQLELLEKIIRASRAWLAEEKAIDLE
jgi:hypothetical protein